MYHPSFRKNKFFGVWYKIFLISYFLTGNRFSMLVLPYCNLVCAFASVFCEKNAIFSAKVAKTSFLEFLRFYLVRVRALYVSIPALAMDEKQLETARVLLHIVMSTRKAIGVLFGTHFVRKNPVFGEIGKKPPRSATWRVPDSDVIASSMLLLVWGTLQSTKNRIQNSL